MSLSLGSLSTMTEPAIRHTGTHKAPFLTVGIDVGGTKMACVVTDASDTVLFHDVVATDAATLSSQIVGLALRAITGVAASTGSPVPNLVAAIGVAVPGLVEPRGGTTELAVNLGAPELDLSSAVERETGVPCFVEHDTRAAAAWVYERHGGDRGGSDLCYLSVGTGIAAGIILDGRLLRGETGLAGEVGHIIVEPDGAKCVCGAHGCLETVAAGPAITTAARRAVNGGRATSLTAVATAADVFAAASAGDEVATEITARVGDHLARAICALVLTLGVQRIVIGGGVAAGGDALIKPIRDALDRERRLSPLVEAAFADASVELLSPDLEPGARGAAAVARQRINVQMREGVAER